ncbi:MAG: ABC transporter substrate-binding protein [Lachnospiraceae bacterium]|nr:ABC transporter substrate-binding protein [Lachnospiraceae bacterium]
MKKRLLALSMAMIMAAGSLAGCTNGSEPAAPADPTTAADPTPTNAPVEVEVEEGVTESEAGEDLSVYLNGGKVATKVDDGTPGTNAKMAVPDTKGWDESKKIYAYSWNDEFGGRLQYVLDEYPQLKDYVEYVNLGCSGTDGTYQQGINAAIADGSKYPSLIAMDNDVAKFYTEAPDSEDYATLNLDDLGVTPDMYVNAYKYTIDYATHDGHLKALTWQATPGCVVYRSDIAQSVLGVSEPADVQEYLKDWPTFFETAQKMKDAGYHMVSGNDEIKYAVWDSQAQPWVTIGSDGSETLSLDYAVNQYFGLSKMLSNGGYSNSANMWSDGWNAGYEGDVFCYFGCTWSLYWCMQFNESGDTTKGQWRTTTGPTGYHWGGSYVAILKDCPNTELAAFLAVALCTDDDIMYKISADTFDYVNNKAAMAKILADGKGASDITGTQNPVETWIESACYIDLSNSSYLDSEIKAAIDKAAEAYWAGTIATVDDAVAQVESDIRAKYSYLK